MDTVRISVSFLELVRKMRAAQVAYFAEENKSRSSLATCKVLERQVDKFLEQNAKELEAFDKFVGN